MSLSHAIREAINATSAENGSDTPDRILAEFLVGALNAFDEATRARDDWHGFVPWIGADITEGEAQ